MGNWNSAPASLDDSEVARLCQQHRFTGNQVNALFRRFQRLDKSQTGRITKEQFLSIPELHINPLIDRILDIFDERNDNEVDFNQFLKVLAVFRDPLELEPLEDGANDDRAQKLRDEKTRFVFRIYDLNEDGFIDHDDFTKVLGMMVDKNLSADEIEKIVTQTISEADKDGDGKISYDEFSAVIEHVDLHDRLSISF